jgi:hypothetical protein
MKSPTVPSEQKEELLVCEKVVWSMPPKESPPHLLGVRISKLWS